VLRRNGPWGNEICVMRLRFDAGRTGVRNRPPALWATSGDAAPVHDDRLHRVVLERRIDLSAGED
jgi:hypothetical protein